MTGTPQDANREMEQVLSQSGNNSDRNSQDANREMVEPPLRGSNSLTVEETYFRYLRSPLVRFLRFFNTFTTFGLLRCRLSVSYFHHSHTRTAQC